MSKEIGSVLRLTPSANLAAMADQLNVLLAQISTRLDQIDGRRGTPTFRSAVNLQGNKITNVGSAASGTDATIKSDLEGIAESAWPVGSIFTSVVSTNPAELLGFGTWLAFGTGKFVVGYDSSDSSFSAARKTGGAKTKDISHTHTINHTHGSGSARFAGTSAVNDAAFSGASGTGGSTTQDILPPYITVYMWERTE